MEEVDEFSRLDWQGGISLYIENETFTFSLDIPKLGDDELTVVLANLKTDHVEVVV